MKIFKKFISRIIVLIFGKKVHEKIRGIYNFNYEIIFSYTGKIEYPDDNIDYTIDRYLESRKVFRELLKNNRKQKFLNAGSGPSYLRDIAFVPNDKITFEEKTDIDLFFKKFDYYTLEYFDLPLEEIIGKGKGEIYFSDSKSYREVNISEFNGYPSGFHAGHIKADLTSEKFEEDKEKYEGYFDLITCYGVLEHVSNPFLCAKNLHYLLKPGGDILIMTPFSQGYHEDPEDFFRFTHTGILKLFTSIPNSNYSVQKWGYDITERRSNRGSLAYNRKHNIGDTRIYVPVDSFGGWREFWMTYCHFRKK